MRYFLQRWPRSARFFVLMLALLQFVAPTWHVCEMGGHVMSHGDPASHAAMAAQAAPAQDGPRQALVCYCAPKESHQADPDTPKLSAAPDSHHPTCLALLLQTMPGDFAAAPALFSISVSFFAPHVTSEEFPAIAVLRHYRGRAPPLTV